MFYTVLYCFVLQEKVNNYFPITLYRLLMPVFSEDIYAVASLISIVGKSFWIKRTDDFCVVRVDKNTCHLFFSSLCILWYHLRASVKVYKVNLFLEIPQQECLELFQEQLSSLYGEDPAQIDIEDSERKDWALFCPPTH